MDYSTYCDATAVPTRVISTSINLAGPSVPYSGVLAVLQGSGGRQATASTLPVFVLHKRFLHHAAIQPLSQIPFTPEFQRNFAEEASAAIGYRSQSLDAVSQWLSQYVRRCPFTGSSNLFSNVDRLYSPPALQSGSSDFLARPAFTSA